jgi:hypothetical protein
MKVRLEELESMPEPEKSDRNMDYTYLFNDMQLSEVVDRHVVSRL